MERAVGKERQLLAVSSLHVVYVITHSVLLLSSSQKDALAIISDTCLQFAQLMYCGQTSEYSELAYFFIVFIARFIPFLYNEPARHSCRQQTQQLHEMLLSTFLRWLDSILYELVWRVGMNGAPHHLQDKLAINGLLMQCVYACISLSDLMYTPLQCSYIRKSPT